jgi:hypothetical protein
MISVRKAQDRGHFDHGWLETFHTFSFGDYYDPEQMGFSDLRVINEDRVQPGHGFPTHAHRDMEIVTYVLEGALEHKDSLGNGSLIRPGDVQRMSAGTGVTHSETNPSPSELVHLLQIWILPERRSLSPGYEQKHFPTDQKRGRLRLLASRDAAEESVTLHQDARVYATILDTGQGVRHTLHPSRRAWVQIARGEAALDGQKLGAGDGAAITEEEAIGLSAREDSTEILLFDLR